MTLGLCSQTDLDNEVKKAARRIEREKKEQGKKVDKAGATLLPTEETTLPPGMGPQPEVEIMAPPEEEAPREETEAEQQARVFAELQKLGSGNAKTED